MQNRLQTIHLKAPGCWINDPNGFIFYKGQYHLFYQCFPYAPTWGRMHWGHAVSRDLVTWEHLDIALYPSKYDDQDGCFSGSAVEDEGRLYLFYTGVRYLDTNQENTNLCRENQFVSAQMKLVSNDGCRFDNINDKSTIIPPMEIPSVGDRTHTRDPKVWRGKAFWYMVLGTCTAEQTGRLLFYRSTDFTNWELLNKAENKKIPGWMWECPDFFEIQESQVLLFSPLDILQDRQKESSHTICAIVEFKEDTCEMVIPDQYQYFDYGLDLYAPQSTMDESGRRIVTAWARMPEAVDGSWNGMFCIPRVVEVEEEHIYFRVHPNVKARYRKKITDTSCITEENYRVEIELEEEHEINIGGFQIRRRGNRICTDRSAVFINSDEYRMRFATPEIQGAAQLDIYVDRNLIEVYVNEGEYVISNVVYGLGSIIRSNSDTYMRIWGMEEGIANPPSISVSLI